MFMDLLVNGESLIWIEGEKKTGCIMILFLFVLFTDEYDFVKLSVGPVQCLLGQIHIKGREREGF